MSYFRTRIGHAGGRTSVDRGRIRHADAVSNFTEGLSRFTAIETRPTQAQPARKSVHDDVKIGEASTSVVSTMSAAPTMSGILTIITPFSAAIASVESITRR